jgi:hypothetical protein
MYTGSNGKAHGERKAEKPPKRDRITKVRFKLFIP